MSARIRSMVRRVRDLHEDETGLQTIEVVAIIAIAAIVLAFIRTFIWPAFMKWVKRMMNKAIADE